MVIAQPELSSARMINEPTIEQFVYYLRLVEDDDEAWRQARSRAFQMDLAALALHMGSFGRQDVRLPTTWQESSDPLVSQPLWQTDWVRSPDGQRECAVEARTYADAYLLHVRYHRRGSHPATIYDTMRQEDVWLPWQEEQLLGHSFFLTGMARLEVAHPLAAQILRQQSAPREAIGDLQTCGLDVARIYRSGSSSTKHVVIYASEGADWVASTLLGRWMGQWEYHRQRLERALSWCEEVAVWLEEQATRLREAIRTQRLGNAWDDVQRLFQTWLAICTRRENAIQSDLASLRWLLSRLRVEGPDTYFAAALRTLRARRQGLAARLVNWRRTCDEAARVLSERRLRAERLQQAGQATAPVAPESSVTRSLPAWIGRGWALADSIHFPDDPQAVPHWSGRRYDTLFWTIAGPGAAGVYALQMMSSAGSAWRGSLDLGKILPAVHALLADAATADVAEEVGDLLFRALLDQAREPLYRRALARARAMGCGLCHRLRIQRAPELSLLPWEGIYDAREGTFPATSAETPFARVMAAARSVAPVAHDLPLRVLLAAAAPRNAARYGVSLFDATQEVAIWQAALRPLVDVNLLRLEIVAGATPASCREAVARFQPIVFHLVAHGVIRRGAPYLLLEGEMGEGRLVGVRLWRECFLDRSETRLVVFQSPQPAAAGLAETQVALAERLHRPDGVALISFRHDLFGRARQRWLSEFYRALALWNPVDAALAEAARQLRAGAESEWLPPALLLPGLAATPWRRPSWAED